MDILNELKNIMSGCESIRGLPGHFVKKYSSIGNIIDTLSIICFVRVVCLWCFVLSKAEAFSSLVQSRYEVYIDLGAEANVLKSNESGMSELLEFFSAADAMTAQIGQFMQTMGFALILAILRILKYLDFQKRLGVVTRTVQAASMDLFHFLILFAIVVGGYTILGFVAFGSTIEAFSSVPDSLMRVSLY